MARIRHYMGRVEVWLDRRERQGVLHAVDALADGAGGGERLEPHGYDDASLEAEYQRFTRPEIEGVWQADLEALRTDLSEAKDVNRLDEDRALTWLRALNRLRLVAAGRLGIDADGWEERVDPRALDDETYAMLSDLGWVQQGIVDCLEA